MKRPKVFQLQADTDKEYIGPNGKDVNNQKPDSIKSVAWISLHSSLHQNYQIYSHFNNGMTVLR